MKVLIKRYPNRKLYNTAVKRYITLDDIADLIREGHDVEVKDHVSGEDLTGITLSQIIFEREKKQVGSLPNALLTSLIRVGGDTMDYMRRSFQASIGAVRMLESEIDQSIDALVRRGEMAEEEARRLRAAIKKERVAGEEEDGNLLDKQLETALHRLNVPSRVDILRLQGQLDELTHALDVLLAEEQVETEEVADA